MKTCSKCGGLYWDRYTEGSLCPDCHAERGLRIRAGKRAMDTYRRSEIQEGRRLVHGFLIMHLNGDILGYRSDLTEFKLGAI